MMNWACLSLSISPATFSFLLPTFRMLMFGYGLAMDVEDIPFVVLDQDHTALIRE